MTSHPERPPLLIRPLFSWRLAILVLLTHAAALAALLALPAPWGLMSITVLISLIYQGHVRVLQRAPWSIRSLVWQADGTWIIGLVSGREIEAALSPSTFVSVPLIVINLHRGHLRRWSLPLFTDALDADQLRRLRQRLRIDGGRGERGRAST